jgi:hypothetical protein
MKEIKIKAYTATDLKEINIKAYEKAYYKWVNSIWETFGSDIVEEEMRQVLLADYNSLYDAPLRWSLSYCQGDGVSFDSFTLTAEQIKDLGEELKSGFYYNVKKLDSHYTHEYTFKVVADTDEEADMEEAEATAVALTDKLRFICRKLETEGYLSSERLTSEETFLDESNDSVYDQYGREIWED